MSNYYLNLSSFLLCKSLLYSYVCPIIGLNISICVRNNEPASDCQSRLTGRLGPKDRCSRDNLISAIDTSVPPPTSGPQLTRHLLAISQQRRTTQFAICHCSGDCGRLPLCRGTLFLPIRLCHRGSVRARATDAHKGNRDRNECHCLPGTHTLIVSTLTLRGQAAGCRAANVL